MMYEKRSLKCIASAVLLALYAAPALAAPVETTPLFSNAVTDKELAKDRGTGVPVINNQAMSELTSTVTGGTDINTISGSNNITTGALAGASGLTAVIQNSGNNVGIQSATTVNVTFISN